MSMMFPDHHIIRPHFRDLGSDDFFFPRPPPMVGFDGGRRLISDPDVFSRGSVLNGRRSSVSEEEPFEVRVDLAGFRPEEIKVDLNVALRTLTVEAEKKEDDSSSSGSGSRAMASAGPQRKTSHMALRKTFTLPETCQLDGLKSTFSEEGILKIVAPPVPAPALKQKPREDATPAQKSSDVLGTARLNASSPAAASASSDLLGNGGNSGRQQDMVDVSKKIYRKNFEETCELKETEHDYSLELPMDGFRPEEMRVEVSATGMVTVAAERAEKADKNGADGGGNVVVANKVFTRKFAMPDDCDVDNLKSSLTRQGVLNIVAPKKKNYVRKESMPVRVVRS